MPVDAEFVHMTLTTLPPQHTSVREINKKYILINLNIKLFFLNHAFPDFIMLMSLQENTGLTLPFRPHPPP